MNRTLVSNDVCELWHRRRAADTTNYHIQLHHAKFCVGPILCRVATKAVAEDSDRALDKDSCFTYKTWVSTVVNNGNVTWSTNLPTTTWAKRDMVHYPTNATMREKNGCYDCPSIITNQEHVNDHTYHIEYTNSRPIMKIKRSAPSSGSNQHHRRRQFIRETGQPLPTRSASSLNTAFKHTHIQILLTYKHIMHKSLDAH
ncbi:hypothetical protein AGLY_015547 [Aphis glycines]|uniref:Uncharacterized protein n=1 Tax=Aphis glycines TaxID=307491 RepID=A0A6G0T0A3_APHGL|nr:hypothetical protein AGLY_015547 [Aphis glycines]